MIKFIKQDKGNVLIKKGDNILCSYVSSMNVLQHPRLSNSIIITDDSNPNETSKGLIISYNSVDKQNSIPIINANNTNELIEELSSNFFFSVKFPEVNIIQKVNKLSTNKSTQVVIEGSYFTKLTSVSFTGNNVVTNINYINSSKIIIDITTSSIEGSYDLIVNNGKGNVTAIGYLLLTNSKWYDLRLGGDSLTIGHALSNDIRHNSSLNVFRDINGLGVVGANSDWRDWIKFEFLSFLRSENSTTYTQFIFKGWAGTVMFGIGSDATNELSTTQYAQIESALYFNSNSSIYAIYGNNGTIGTLGTQLQSFFGLSNSNTYKLKISDTGGNGSIWQLFQLPSSAPEYWDDENNLIYTIVSNLTPDEINLIPMVLPRQLGLNGRIISIKI